MGSSVHGIFQARTLEWVAMLSSRDLPNPGIEPTSLMSPALAGGFFTTRATWEAQILGHNPFPKLRTHLLIDFSFSGHDTQHAGF